MLVLRKEIKMGAAIGLTVIGIVGVYGLMASLSGGDKVAKTDTTAITDPTTHQDAVKNSHDGFPPTADDVVKPAPVPSGPVPSRKDVDPFAESVRKDGNPDNAAVLQALSTGRLVTDTKSKPIDTVSFIDSPAGPSGVKAAGRKSPLVVLDTPAEPDAKSDGKSDDKADAPTNPAKPAEPGGKYTVQSGDTFSTIAAKVYGSKKFSAVLVKANPDVNPSRLRIGHVINVPPKQSAGSVRGAVVEQASLTAPIDASRQYRVAAGDTLSRIAAKLYGKPGQWEAIYAANKATIGAEPGRLKVGSLLTLPKKPTTL